MHSWHDNNSCDTVVIRCYVAMIWVVWTSRCWHNNRCGWSVLAVASVHCTLYSAIRASHLLTADNKGPAAGGIFSSLHLCRRKFGYICHPSNQPLAIHIGGVNWNWKERSLYRYWMQVCVWRTAAVSSDDRLWGLKWWLVGGEGALPTWKEEGLFVRDL